MRFVATSDTHNRHRALAVPDGDVFLHCGDMTNRGTRGELKQVIQWIGALPHEHKIIIAGNHDLGLENMSDEQAAWWRHLCREEGVTYLEGEHVGIGGWPNERIVWGGPWTPYFWGAFNVEPPIREWELIPEGVDVVMTHGPAFGRLDRTQDGHYTGCHELYAALERARPRIHVHGHIHEAAGEATTSWGRALNVAACDRGLDVSQQPVVFDV